MLSETPSLSLPAHTGPLLRSYINIIVLLGPWWARHMQIQASVDVPLKVPLHPLLLIFWTPCRVILGGSRSFRDSRNCRMVVHHTT